ncbi:MAG: asparagine synthase (glutamine-hydrolyzing), partial [Candidatus Electrothrix sp. AR1]|nr:asparagine synthase (glutamine-hydrolyzing) [Candidatus Electrothrix sp. AR1]
MCGIVGFISPQGFNEEEAGEIVCRMRDRLIHRGPDEAGSWLDAKASIALAHRRLSILDLTAAGSQPMVSAGGRYVIAFNGEINHLDIRREVEKNGFREWRGHSDTEILLAAIEIWGVEKALQKSVGMFALALWDRHEQTLTLARDRMGEKPLYYGWQGNTFLFGSELKALQAHPEFSSEIDRQVVPIYLRHGYIPAPWSIWKDIFKLKPGCMVQMDAQQMHRPQKIKPYWSLGEIIEAGDANSFSGTDTEAIDALESQLRLAVAGQMEADVPLGAFLSGGIDSSTVVALMQSLSLRPVKTFSIGFDEAGYNEAQHAKAVAKHLCTDHTELYVTSDQARNVIPDLATIYDEPFGDSSAIPTHLVSRLAKKHVTVSLSGDGGDELFGGYGRYFNHKAMRIWQNLCLLPAPIRHQVGALVQSSLVSFADEMLHGTASLLSRPLNKSLKLRAGLIAGLTACHNMQDFYRVMTSQWNWPPVAYETTMLNYGIDSSLLQKISEPVQQMMATDSLSYLPDDILVKVDRAAMAVSLETRVPLLDHRVVALAWQMPYK